MGRVEKAKRRSLRVLIRPVRETLDVESALRFCFEVSYAFEILFLHHVALFCLVLSALINVHLFLVDIDQVLKIKEEQKLIFYSIIFGNSGFPS